MRIKMITIRQLGLSLAVVSALGMSACDLDFTDPNNPNEEEAISTIAGLKQVGVGLQAEYANEISDPIYVDALVNDQIGAILQAFESYRNADAGLPINNSEGPSTETWTGMYDVVQVADVLLTNVPLVPMEAGTQSGLLALAKLFKAMAFGNLLNVYERIPLDVGLDNLDPEFATRQAGYAEVLKLLNEARAHITTVPVSAEFNRDVIAPGFDLANTIDAMIARYSLIAGDFTAAATAAARVSRTVYSEFRYSASDVNPIWNMWFNSNNPFRLRPEDRFRLQAQAGDQRVGYWVAESTRYTASNAASPLDSIVRYSLREHSIPAYQPDEMLLIRAEVAARQNNLAEALTLLNMVRTPCTSALPEPVACLPALTAEDVPTQAAMLAAILREREYELFLQGLRWSDLRRFGIPTKYTFMMVSRSECDNNPNAPRELCALQTTAAL
jgi:starch-binding outer membrane protein, SusD/RagB family